METNLPRQVQAANHSAAEVGDSHGNIAAQKDVAESLKAHQAQDLTNHKVE